MISTMPMLGGVRLAPLPASVLPSTMAVYEPASDDEHGGSYAAKPVTVSNVRFERAAERRDASSGGAQGGYAYSDDSRGTVYVDAASSAGAYEVPEGSLVAIDGGDAMEVVRVQRFDHPDGACHHWEVAVR